jgi:hypothetical protein
MQNASADITRPPSHCEARRCHHRRPPAEGLRSPDPRADCDGCNRTAQRHPSPDQPRAGPSLRQDSQTTLIRSATTRPITSEVLPAADGTKPKNLGALQIAMRISPSRNVSRGVLHTCPGLAERRTSMATSWAGLAARGGHCPTELVISRPEQVGCCCVALRSVSGWVPVGFRSASGIHGIMQPS